MRDQLQADNPPRGRRWLVTVATTSAAWLVAFLIVMALLALIGDQLASLPLALRALVISGVLVTLMVNLVMPVLSVAIARRLAGTRLPRPAAEPDEPDEPDEPVAAGVHAIARMSIGETDHDDA